MDAAKGQGDALDAAFRAAECCYHLDRYAQAVEILATIAARRDISAQDRLQAKVQRGICMIEQQHLPEAEQALREALDDWEAAKDTERLDAYFPAQAEFFLGEIFRLHFEGVALDPDRGEDQLGKALENKCELLLSAQGHYLRAIRMGEGQWATASGFRVGALYEALRKAMLEAKVPASLDAEQAQVYREELRRRVRVLVTKAMAVYERTLEAAERLGIESPFVTETRRSLERMKELLLEEPEKAPAETQASLKSPP
jgi:tetratricopeptide (TPR) repeat protein